jgi:hypothetical protein
MGNLTDFTPSGIKAAYFVGSNFLTQGNTWFVKPSTGSDGNTGKSPLRAVKTLAKALSLATANQNDVIYMFAESNSASSTTDYQSATLDWNKDLVHLIGIGADSYFSNRARIAQLSTATGVAPLVKVSADGCIFQNISIFHGVDDATSLVALEVTGTRNVFRNCHIAGMGHATQVVANNASLKLTGAEENRFIDCRIGLDTITRDNSTKGEIWCDTAATRNVFENCDIYGYIDNAGYVHCTIEDGTAIDRGLIFKECLIYSKSTNKATTQTSIFSIPAGIAQGAIMLKNTKCFSDGGATDWDSNDRGIIWNDSVAAAASAAGGIMTNQ